jgi:hypothetical protein
MAKPKPNAPTSLPKYLAEGMAKQDDDTLRDVIEYAETLLEARAQVEPEIPETADVIEEPDDSTGGTLVKEKVKCGKSGCKCADGDLHGPYLYRYWSESGTTKSEYVGKPE